MQPVAKPSKEAVRAWTQQRQAARKPPPTPEQIRTELGWWMLTNNRVQSAR